MRIITGCQFAWVRQGGGLPVEGELPVIEGAAEQRQELAPEHAAEPRTGRKTPGWQASHFEPSNDSPPPGTTQWTCG